VGCFSMFCVLIGLIGSLRIACCLSVYLVLGGALTLGAMLAAGAAQHWSLMASCCILLACLLPAPAKRPAAVFDP